MIFIPPPEIKEKEKRIKPYEVGCHLREDTPQEIIELENEVNAWYDKAFKEAMDLCLL